MPFRAYSMPDALTLRDQLAADRTLLANERTLLAHVRTALGLLGGGGALLYVGDAPWLLAVGLALIVAAPLALGAGVWRYVRVRKRLGPLLARPTEAHEHRPTA